MKTAQLVLVKSGPPRQATRRRPVARSPWWSALWLPPLTMMVAVLMVWSAALLRWLAE